jgi:bacillithiol biosynthesis cysteine-adding enzyme BshC
VNLVFQPTPLGTSPGLDAAGLVTRRVRPADPSLRPAFVAREEAASRLEQLFEPGTLCVTTGQQPGLLTGPLFTIYKALTAVAIARRLERAGGRPVVPVFWVGGDDHDFAEANHLYVPTLANEVERVVLRERETEAPSLPLYREVLGPEIDDVTQAVARNGADTEFRTGVFEWLARHYRPDRDLASAFAGAVAELLGRYGMVVFVPTHAAAKRAMSPLLLDALARTEELDRALAHRATELEQQGSPVPVGVGDGAAGVMIEGALGRDRLLLDGERFVARRSGQAWSLEDLRTLATAEPERFSPNVLLRPVVEAALLPTVAYVAGPGELRYLPQCAPLYDGLAVSPQVPVPRWSGHVVESRIAKVLDKYGIAVADLAGPDGQLEASLVRDDMPAEAVEAIARLREAIGAEYDRIRAAAESVDPTLQKTVQSAEHSALGGVADVEKRIVAHLKKRNTIVGQQVAKARHNLYPLGRPQERVFNVVPYLIRYGSAFLDAALEAVETSFRLLGSEREGS